MAVIFGVLDADGSRRSHVRKMLPESLSGLTYLSREETKFKNLDIYYEASASTPVSIATDHLHATDRIAFVVGDYDAPYSMESDAAQRLLRRSANDTSELSCISGQDGYYLAMLYDGHQITLGVDVLGMFPLYYWSRGDVFMFGTSPSLFKAHPLFVAEPDTYAIASILLISYISGGRSLYKDVRRNRPGHYVVWSANAGVKENEGNSLRMSDSGFNVSYNDTREKIAACCDTFYASLTQLPRVGVLLSGGQDSRMVAGYIDKYFPSQNVQAVSLGNKSDNELQYAIKTSHALCWQHHYRDIEEKEWVSYATNQLRLESLQGPLANFNIDTARNLLEEGGRPFFSGYCGDHVLGDSKIYNAFSNKTGMFEFDQLFQYLNQYGFESMAIAELAVDGKLKVASDEVLNDLFSYWKDLDCLDFQKAWMFTSTHRLRYHVGSIIWRLTLGAWHLLPYYNRKLLEIVSSMPLGHFRDRRMQVDIIKEDFPRLATLPLDCNRKRPAYIIKPLYRQFLDGFPPVSSVSWKLHQLLHYKREEVESRYYYRTYNFNSPAWQSVRKEADRYRGYIGNLLNQDVVDRYLPVCDKKAEFNDVIIDSLKMKTLIGLMLWNGMERT